MMNHKLDHIQNAMDYLEAHLDADISIDELAAIAGYSKDHFCRLFTEFLGMSITAYRTKRRIQQTLYLYVEEQTNPKADKLGLTAIAGRFGFETHAGFYKAFKKEYGCSVRYYIRHFSANVAAPKAINLHSEAILNMTTTQIKHLLNNWQNAAGDLTSLEIRQADNVGGQVICNHVWHIGNQYILKTMPNVALLRNHLLIGEQLDKAGFSAQTAIPTNQGQKTLESDGRTFVLMNRVTGRFLTPEDHMLSDLPVIKEIGHKYGVAIGELHGALAKIETDASRDDQMLDTLMLKESNIAEVLKSWAIPGAKEVLLQWQCPLSDDFYNELLQSLEALGPQLPRQVIHRDPNPSNIIWQDGEIQGFIDFSISEINCRIMDLCYCATGILSEAWAHPRAKAVWPVLFDSMIEGYDVACENGLSNAEKQAIPKIIVSIFLIFIAWLSKNASYEGCAPANREMLHWYLQSGMYQ